MVLQGPEAWLAYLAVVGHDTATDEEIADFEFDTEPMSFKVRAMDWARMLVKSGMVTSNTAADRMIKHGAVDVDGERMTARVTGEFGSSFVVRCGRVQKRVNIVGV